MTLVHRTLRIGPFDNNVYIVACPNTRQAAVIDVGFEPETVVAEIRDAGLEVRYLLNTHAHYDHAAGMRAAQAALGGDYYLHPAERPLLAILTQQGAMFGLPPAQGPDVIHDLADGMRLELGESTLEVILAPGHSPGSVCFLSGGRLWDGDVLFAGSIGRTDLPGGSFKTLEASIRGRLFTLSDDVQVFPGHGPPTTIGRERLHNPFVGEVSRLA
jgi:glyoxylase-like metal-dependent hydrolase (beta-lactamase superfamily II)